MKGIWVKVRFRQGVMRARSGDRRSGCHRRHRAAFAFIHSLSLGKRSDKNRNLNVETKLIPFRHVGRKQWRSLFSRSDAFIRRLVVTSRPLTSQLILTLGYKTIKASLSAVQKEVFGRRRASDQVRSRCAGESIFLGAFLSSALSKK